MKQKRGVCSKCATETLFTLHRQVFINGSDHFLWICECGKKNPDDKVLFISRSKVEQHLSTNDIDEVPVLMPDLYCRCAVCGDRAVEMHHWMPRGISNDADSWPKDYLCKKHHDLWHRLVTPNLKYED
jgi:hypothetical protein